MGRRQLLVCRGREIKLPWAYFVRRDIQLLFFACLVGDLFERLADVKAIKIVVCC